jgi:protein-S-isoprenylcysteine O-methyltransferase Ste14
VRTEALTRAARWRVPIGFACAAIVFWLATPTGWSLAVGMIVASAGEGLRVWAAGHLHKSREVTASGPYRWVAHPLYIGSAIMGAGVAIAANRLAIAIVLAVYLVVTITIAVKAEEAFLRARFGGDYDRYRRQRASVVSGASGASRRFSWQQARANREYRAVIGMALVALTLWLKMAWLH